MVARCLGAPFAVFGAASGASIDNGAGVGHIAVESLADPVGGVAEGAEKSGVPVVRCLGSVYFVGKAQA